MKFLLIDTTKKEALICVGNNKTIEKIVLDELKKHSEFLLSEIENALLKLNIKLSDLDCMGVVVGPGSFTGIRISVATIKAFATVFNNCKLISFNAFEALSKTIKNGTILLDCTKNSYYACEVKNNKILSYNILNSAEIENLKTDVYKIKEEPLLNENSYKNIKLLDNYCESILEHFVSCYNSKQFSDLAKIEPFYVQPSQAEIELKKKEENNAN